MRTFIVSGLTFYVAIVVLKETLQFLFSVYPGFLASIDIKWAHLWVAATLGGLMALRLKRAYGVLVTGVTIFAIFIVYSRF